MTDLLTDPGVRSGLDLLTASLEAQLAFRGAPSVSPGLSIAIVHDQTLVWARGFGVADAETARPATPDTLYRIGSITKLFTATAVMQLRDAGKIRLDDPLATYLPWFEIARAGGKAITVRHLITHTSGLPREAAFPYWMDDRFPGWDEIRSKLSQQNQTLRAESRWKYSNLAVALAGEVVAVASGELWADYVRAHILGPLGMTATLTGAPAPDDPAFAAGYARSLPDSPRTRAPWTDLKAIGAAGGMTSSVADLAKFAMLQFRNDPAVEGPVVRGATLAEMQRPHWVAPEWDQGWGLGFSIYRSKGNTYVGHGGAVRGYRTDFRMRLEDRVAVIAFTNSDDADPAKYVEKAFEWVAPAIVKATAPPPAVADPAWQRYVGRYRNPFADIQVLVRDGQLTMLIPALPDPLLASSRLVPVREHTFRVDTKNGYGIPGELVVFEHDATGHVMRMRTGETWADRIETW